MKNEFLTAHTPPGTKARFDSYIRDLLEQKGLDFYGMMSFHMGFMEKNGETVTATLPPRLHGWLTLAIAYIFDLDPRSRAICAYALAAEFLDAFFQVHQDIQDGNTERNDRPSLWWVWGPSQAINAGDGMHALARLHIYSAEDSPGRISQAIKIFDESVLERCEGEYSDIMYQERIPVSTEICINLAKKRGGSMVGASMALGAVGLEQLNGGDICQALKAFGINVGAARQIYQDMSILIEDGLPHEVGRSIAKRTNIMVAHAMEQGDLKAKRRISELYMRRFLDKPALDELAGLSQDAGGKEFAKETIEKLMQEAAEALKVPNLTSQKRSKLCDLGSEWLEMSS